MYEFTQINAMSAGDTVRERQQTSARSRAAGSAPRHTTRRHLASGLRRLAEHLDT